MPPTTEAFTLQMFRWKNALQLNPQMLEPTDHGWMKQQSTKSPQPTTVPSDTLP